MYVQLGETPQAGFDQPLRLMSDCHRRIEHFLDVLIRAVRERTDGFMDFSTREALEKALTYFTDAAPWHRRDEEDSLFPRLRGMNDDRLSDAFEQLDDLEQDHDIADGLHQEIDQMARQWLDTGHLEPTEAVSLLARLNILRQLYRRHIAIEEERVFPLAAECLSPTALQVIGGEMAHRRDAHRLKK